MSVVVVRELDPYCVKGEVLGLLDPVKVVGALEVSDKLVGTLRVLGVLDTTFAEVMGAKVVETVLVLKVL